MYQLDSLVWFPLCASLTGVGLVLSWQVWRRRGAAPGARATAWSLLPLAAYLTGVVVLFWRIGTAVSRWVAGFVLSPTVWAGVAVAGVAAVLFAVSALLYR